MAVENLVKMVGRILSGVVKVSPTLFADGDTNNHNTAEHSNTKVYVVNAAVITSILEISLYTLNIDTQIQLTASPRQNKKS